MNWIEHINLKEKLAIIKIHLMIQIVDQYKGYYSEEDVEHVFDPNIVQEKVIALLTQKTDLKSHPMVVDDFMQELNKMLNMAMRR